MLPYFNSIGFHIVENENPADFMLDVCSGTLQRKDHPDFVPSVSIEGGDRGGGRVGDDGQVHDVRSRTRQRKDHLSSFFLI